MLVVGDSIARHVYASVLRLAARDADAHALSSQEKHRGLDARALVDGGVATFRWAPFARNVTATLSDVFDANVGDSTRTWEVVILGAALWDALHVRSVETYARDVRALAATLAATRKEFYAKNSAKNSAKLKFFWLAAPRVMDDALMDPAKRTHMTDAKVAAYGDAARNTPGFLFSFAIRHRERRRTSITGFARGRRRAPPRVRGVGG